MFDERRVEWRTGVQVDDVRAKGSRREFFPPVLVEGLATLRARKLTAPAIILLLEAYRRTKTNYGPLRVTSKEAKRLKLTRKECRTAIAQFESKVRDIVVIHGQGKEARVLELTAAGISLLDSKRHSPSGPS